MANCVENNLCKFCKKILNYTENNDICLRGSFLLPHTVYFQLYSYCEVAFWQLLLNEDCIVLYLTNSFTTSFNESLFLYVNSAMQNAPGV